MGLEICVIGLPLLIVVGLCPLRLRSGVVILEHVGRMVKVHGFDVDWVLTVSLGRSSTLVLDRRERMVNQRGHILICFQWASLALSAPWRLG